jgi:hypothetical protein
MRLMLALFLVILIAIALPLIKLLLRRGPRAFATVVALLFVAFVFFYLLAECR